MMSRVLFSLMLLSQSESHRPMPVCGFPNPFKSDGMKRCYSYLEVPYICDPNGQLSLTEAEEIDNFVKFRYSSCAKCIDASCKAADQMSSIHRLSEVNIGLAFIRQGVSKLAMETLYLACLQHSDLDVFDQIDTITVSPEIIGKLYASILRNSWSHPQCQTDVLLLFVESWQGDNSLRKSNDLSSLKRSVFYAFSKRLKTVLTTDMLENVYAHVRLESYQSRSLSQKAISFLRYLRKTLSHRLSSEGNIVVQEFNRSKLVKTRHIVAQWPSWAIITAAVCGGVIVLCTVIGVLIKAPTYSNRKNQATSKGKAANLDMWKAGFAGGVLGQSVSQHKEGKGASISLFVGKKFKGGSRGPAKVR